MVRDLGDSYLSELENELELEMDDLEFEYENELDEELDDAEFEEEFDDAEALQEEFETGDEESGDYAERFYELSQMEFELESELDRELSELLGEMEREYFFGGVKRFLKSKGKGLLKKGLKYAAGRIPALKAIEGITQLARGNLKGSLLALAKTALAAHPAGAAALPALNALGFGTDTEANREAWDNYVEVAREAYENLAENLNEAADDPLVANEIAKNSFRTAFKTVQSNARPAGIPRSVQGASLKGRGRKRVVYLSPGEYLVVRRRR